MQKLNPKAVIFDLGSTLIDYPSTTWEQVSTRCTISARKYLSGLKYNLPPEREFCQLFKEVKDDLRSAAAESLREWTMIRASEGLLKRLGIASENGLADRFFDVYYETMQELLYVYDDTVPTLERIRTKYKKIGLVSNTVFPERIHRAELKLFGIEPFLDFAIFSSTFGWRKPHRNIFYRAAELAGFDPADCLYIGDRYIEDVQGPNSIGMPAILKEFPDRGYPPEISESVRRISRLSDLSNHIDI